MSRVLFLVGLCSFANVAHAGTPEMLGDALLHPTAPDVITLIYENVGGGYIHTTDGGEHWGLGCVSALGSGREPYASAVDGAGSLYLAFLFDGVLVDDGGRCTFDSLSPFEGLWISDISVHPNDPNVVYAITSAGDQENGIWRRTNGGDFEPIGNRERVMISRVRVAALPGGGDRYYETISRGETMEMIDDMPVFYPNYFVRSSENDGMTWTEHAFPKTQGSLRLELVDPANPDRLVASVDNLGESEVDQVFISDDAGANFRELITVEEVGGVALSADGRLWVGDEEGGLFAGALDATTLETISDKARPTCVRFDPLTERIYICEDFGFGYLVEPDNTFVQLFDITDTEGFLECPERDPVAECEDQMFMGFCGPSHYPGAPICWMNYPDKVPPPDAGGGGDGDGDGDGGTDGAVEPDGGATSDGGGAKDSDDGGCSCSVPGGARRPVGWPGSWLPLGALALVFARKWWRWSRPAPRDHG